MRAFRFAAILALIAAAFLSFGALAEDAAPNVNSIIINPNPPYQASIWSDKSNYAIGERLTVNFRVNKDAYAYVFSIDANGEVRLIFPNIYSDDNRVKANKTYSLPDNNKYNFTIGGPAGTDQLVLISTPSRMNDTDWLRRSLQQNSFAPQVNINIAADGFMAQIKSVIITPVYKNEWSSAYASYTVGGWASVPPVVNPPVVVNPPIIVNPPVVHPPVIVNPPVNMPVYLYGRLSVTTNPAGARVFLNGADQGSGPVNLSNLKYGEYEITALYPGYYTATRTVQVMGSAVQSVNIQLEKIVDKGLGTSVYTRLVDLGWPSTGPFTESFSYLGYAGSISLRAESIIGMITKVNATASIQGSAPVMIAEMTASGSEAAYKDKIVEYLVRPFLIRITVVGINNVTGTLTGSVYIESIKLYIEVFYVG